MAVEVAGEAAALVHSIRNEAVARFGTKSTETDVVTAADLAAERLLRQELARRRPGEPVLGEEEGAGADADVGSGDGVRWVVDPIDGTVNYLYGLPWYAVSVAAQVAGRSVAGAVVEPASGRVWSAAAGYGADCDGRRLRVSAAGQLRLSLIATGFGYARRRRRWQSGLAAALLSAARDVRRLGAASLDLCAVAAGWVDGYVEHGLHRWDWAAGALIAQEAGAVVVLPAGPGPGPDAPRGWGHGSADGPGQPQERLPDPGRLGGDAVLAAAPGIAGALAQVVAGAVDEARAGLGLPAGAELP